MKLDKFLKILNGSVAHITASAKLLTALKNRRNIPGARSPRHVIRRRTESTVHLCSIKASASDRQLEEKKHRGSKKKFNIYYLPF